MPSPPHAKTRSQMPPAFQEEGKAGSLCSRSVPPDRSCSSTPLRRKLWRQQKAGGWAVGQRSGSEPNGSGRRLSSPFLRWDSPGSPVTEDASRGTNAALYRVITHDCFHNLPGSMLPPTSRCSGLTSSRPYRRGPSLTLSHVVQGCSMESSRISLAQQAGAVQARD